MGVAKVELFLLEAASRLSDLANAAKLFVSTILDLQSQSLFVNSGARWVEQDCHTSGLPWRNDV